MTAWPGLLDQYVFFTFVEISHKRMLFCDLHRKLLRNSERHLLLPHPPSLHCALSAWFWLVVERLHLAHLLHLACVWAPSTYSCVSFLILWLMFVHSGNGGELSRWENGQEPVCDHGSDAGGQRLQCCQPSATLKYLLAKRNRAYGWV